MMIFEVKDMTCGHCVKAITQAVTELDAQASVHCDLASHRVSVDTEKSPEAVAEAIAEAGYSPARLD